MAKNTGKNLGRNRSGANVELQPLRQDNLLRESLREGRCVESDTWERRIAFSLVASNRRSVPETVRCARRRRRAPHPGSLQASVDARNEPRSVPAVGVVLLAELCAQKGLFGPNARQNRRNDQRCQNYPCSRTKSQGPSEHQDKHSKIARMANDPVNAVSD